jgi:hypothetical protein
LFDIGLLLVVAVVFRDPGRIKTLEKLRTYGRIFGVEPLSQVSHDSK